MVHFAMYFWEQLKIYIITKNLVAKSNKWKILQESPLS